MNILNKYVPYLNRKEKYQLFYGGTFAGKTHFLTRKLILDLLAEKQYLMVARGSHNTLKDSVYAEFVHALEEMDLIKNVRVLKEDLSILFPNGSEISFEGADNKDILLALLEDADLCWIEEATEISKELFKKIERVMEGKIFLSFNPISDKHWIKEMFFNNQKEDTVICHSTYLDNEHLGKGQIEALLELKNRPLYYKIYALGEWQTPVESEVKLEQEIETMGHSGFVSTKKVYSNEYESKGKLYKETFLIKVNEKGFVVGGLKINHVLDASTGERILSETNVF